LTEQPRWSDIWPTTPPKTVEDQGESVVGETPPRWARLSLWTATLLLGCCLSLLYGRYLLSELRKSELRRRKLQAGPQRVCLTSAGEFQSGFGNSFGYANIAADFAVAEGFVYLFPPFMSNKLRYQAFGTHGALDHFNDLFGSEKAWWLAVMALRQSNRLFPLVCTGSGADGNSYLTGHRSGPSTIGTSTGTDTEVFVPLRSQRCDFFGTPGLDRGVFRVPVATKDERGYDLLKVDDFVERLEALQRETGASDAAEQLHNAISELALPFGSFGESQIPEGAVLAASAFDSVKAIAQGADSLHADPHGPIQFTGMDATDTTSVLNRIMAPCRSSHRSTCTERMTSSDDWMNLKDGELEEARDILETCDVLLVGSTAKTGYSFFWSSTIGMISEAYRDSLEIRIEKGEISDAVRQLVHVERSHLTHHFYAMKMGGTAPSGSARTGVSPSTHWQDREEEITLVVHYRLGDVKKCNLYEHKCSEAWAAKHIGPAWPLFAVESVLKVIEGRREKSSERPFRLNAVLVSDSDATRDDEVALLNTILRERHGIELRLPSLDETAALDLMANADILVVGSSSFGVTATVLNTHVKFVMAMFAGQLPQGGARHTIEVPYLPEFYDLHRDNTEFVRADVRDHVERELTEHFLEIFPVAETRQQQA